MPKYYCDYCDTYLTHDSPSVRKTHCGGRKHKENVCTYYQKWLEDQVQKLVDDTTAAFKAGKIHTNPFQSSTGIAPPAGGVMIPPPAILQPRLPPATPQPGMKPPMGGMIPPPGMMPPIGPMGPMMPMAPMMPGMRPMAPMGGPSMTPMGPGPMMHMRPMNSAVPPHMPMQ